MNLPTSQFCVINLPSMFLWKNWLRWTYKANEIRLKHVKKDSIYSIQLYSFNLYKYWFCTIVFCLDSFIFPIFLQFQTFLSTMGTPVPWFFRPGKNSSPTGILVFPSKTYCKTREFFHWKGTFHCKKTGAKSILSVLK